MKFGLIISNTQRSKIYFDQLIKNNLKPDQIILLVNKIKIKKKLNLKKLKIMFGGVKIIENGELYSKYNEQDASDYMKNEKIDIFVDLNMGNKNFTAYTMDLSKKYIDINSDYRT